jgi:DNA-binding NarL/FixJ family response regulator
VNRPETRHADHPIRVVLADDQVLVRAGFRMLLDVEDDITVVGEAADGAQAVHLARTNRPDVVLMDIRMPVLDGPAELLHAIRVVAAGEALLAPRITRRLIAQFTAARTAHQVAERRLSVLTQREREVLALVGQGLSNDEIAVELTLSPATARTHVSRTMTKLGARDRAQLVVAAYQTGLVKPGPTAGP